MIRTFHGHWASTDFTKNDFACMNCQRRGRSDEEVHTSPTDTLTHTHTHSTHGTLAWIQTRARAHACTNKHTHIHTWNSYMYSLRPSLRPSLSLSSTISLSLPLSFFQTFKYHHHAQLDEMVNSALEKGEYKAATGLEVMVRGDLCTVENIVSYTPPGPHTCSIKLKP